LREAFVENRRINLGSGRRHHGSQPKRWKQPVTVRKKKVRGPIMGKESIEQGKHSGKH